MSRFVFPELFQAAGAPITVKGEPRLALRWLLHASLGVPRALFRVWRFEGKWSPVTTTVAESRLDANRRLVRWTGGPAALVELNATLATGTQLVVRGHSGPYGAGHAVTEQTLYGPQSSVIVRLAGCIGSVTLEGVGTIAPSARITPLYPFVNDVGWRLLETVGLPADTGWGATGYPPDPQGVPGLERPPVDAAIRRVLEGTPDGGWPGITDRGTAVDAFQPPDPGALVHDELSVVREHVRTLLESVGNPAEHARFTMTVDVDAPRSVHGVAAAPHWQARARRSSVTPLGTLLLAAATDPFAALALGFGTTLSGQQLLGERDFDATHAMAVSVPDASLQRLGLYPLMVTVEHKVSLERERGLSPIVLSGELAALFMAPQQSGAPATPVAVSTSPPALVERAIHLDPPATRDERWLEVVRLSWARPRPQSAVQDRPTAFAVARGLGTAALDIRLERRRSGGWTPFVHASDPDGEVPVLVEFTEGGLPEQFPGEPGTVVYSVAAMDWFGRWSDWRSTDHTRHRVAPQTPAVTDVHVEIGAGSGTTRPGTAHVEFVWDWSHRSPRDITIRLLVHEEGAPAPAAAGSVLAVGATAVSDRVIDFSSAGIDSPPAGVTIVTERNTGNLRTYRVEIPGLSLAFAAHPRIRVTARAQGRERVGFGVASAWSRDRSTLVASPVAPPPPFVPAEMWWASVPDPRGIARTELEWSGSASGHVVYHADETALRRELDLPSADLEVPAAERLPALRALDFGRARRAFRRVAGPLTATSHAIELPRGSKLIHFYGITSVSVTGVEGDLPAAGNAYFAVAAASIEQPEIPQLIARDRNGVVQLHIEVPELRVETGRVAIHRAPNRARALTPELAGPPIAVLEASMGTRADGRIRFTFDDTAPGVPWQSVFYRAIAHAQTDLARGVYGGASPATRAIEVVVSTSDPPVLTDLQPDLVPAEPAHRLIGFHTAVTLARTLRGVHLFALQIIHADGSIETRRVDADVLPLLTGLLPTPAEQPDTIFRHDATDPRAGRTYAWVRRDAQAVIVEISDPAGRTTRVSWP